jgi:hypothetical protein
MLHISIQRLSGEIHCTQSVGVYVAPVPVMMVATWFVLIALRRAADHFGVLHGALRYADVER